MGFNMQTMALFADTTGLVAGIIFAMLGVVTFSFFLLLAKQYKRCPSNRVLVIYGKTFRTGQAARTIHGGASFVWPLIQDYAYLSLEPIQIEVPLRGALSAENIRVNVPSVFTVAIDTKPEVMQNAAVRLLGLTVGDIRKQAEEIIFGQLRQVIASMNIEEINQILHHSANLRAESAADAAAILFAQHFADTRGKIDPAARETLRGHFSNRQVREILAYIHAIYLGNLVGNTFEYAMNCFGGCLKAGRDAAR